MTAKKVVLKEGREKALRNRHPWIFSGSIATMPDCKPGEVFPVFSSTGEFLAKAYFNPSQSLIGRVLDFEDKEIDVILEDKILKAMAFRKKVLHFDRSDCYRLINAEGDGLPGLIIDIYAKVAVIQVSTFGMELLKDKIIKLLVKYIQPQAIYEKSTSSSRQIEGLNLKEGLLYGHIEDEVQVKENGIHFIVDIVRGQKTGFFLDQREMRLLISEFAKDRTVLNAFSYSGGFSLYALKGGAKKVVSLDRDTKALKLAKRNVELNGFSHEKHDCIDDDVFSFLDKSRFDYDMVILDPPAFAKKQKDIVMASRGYKEINKKAFLQMPSQSFLLTCSCSYYMDKDLFQQVVFQAASEAKRSVKILSHHIQAKDHPVMLSHLEGQYLKSLFLYIE